MGKSGRLSRFYHKYLSKSGADRNVRGFFLYLAASSFVFLLYIFFGTQDNVFRLLESVRVNRQQTRQIARMKEDIAAMDREMEYLTNDRDSLERFAREKFGFCAEGEDVYFTSDK